MTTIKFYPIDIESKGNVIKIFGRTTDNKRIFIVDPTFSPYVLVEPKPGELKRLQEKLGGLKENDYYVTSINKIEKDDLGEKKEFLKVSMNHPDALSTLIPLIKKIPGTNSVKEYDIKFHKRYIIDKNITPLTLCEVEGEIKNTDFDVDIAIEGSIKPLSSDTLDLKLLSFDIEIEDFFDIESVEFPIISISLATKDYKKVITWKKVEHPESYIEVVKDEAKLIEKFKEEIKKLKPDCIVGYFSDGFDFPYLIARAKKLEVDFDINLDNTNIRITRGREISVKTKGIVHIDIFKFIKKVMANSLKFDSYSLDFVAKEIIGERKKEFNMTKMKNKWHNGEVKEICEYNLHDSVITLKLAEKILPNIIELVKTTSLQLFDVCRTSYGKLVENYLMKNAYALNEIIQAKPAYEDISIRKMYTYQGASVMEPSPGLYEDVIIFDFMSLYPTIVIAKNICPSTLKKTGDKEDYKTPEIEEDGKMVTHYFSTKKEGFIPTVIKDLILRRNRIKEMLREEENPILEARSYALKTIANSMYGYTGFFGSRWYSKECASSITAFARYYINDVINKTKKEGFNVIYSDSVDGKTKIFTKKGKRIYEEDIERLFERVDNERLGKEYNSKENIKVLTLDDKGNSVFKPIKHVMRHKTNKKMYRINFTNNWYIDVTEDHSLMAYQSSKFNASKMNKQNPLKRIIELKPEEIKKKANTIISLKKIPNKSYENKNLAKEFFEFMGYFIGDGSFMRNKTNREHNKDYYLRLSLGKDKEEIFNKLINPLKELRYIKNHWWSKSRQGDIILNGLKLVKLISENCRSSEGKKIIPKWLFYEKDENINAFLRGLFSADGCVMIRNDAPIIKVTTIYQNYAEEIRKLLYRAGISHAVFKENSINKYKSKDKTYSSGSQSINIILKNKEIFAEKIGFLLDRKNKLANIKTKNLQKKSIINFEFDLQSVKSIEEIKTPDYVYDIEVDDNHRFFANYVLVHNTDSIAFTLENKKEEEAINFLKKLNEELPSLMELELEGFYPRGIFVSRKGKEGYGAKKKYALIDQRGKIKIRGFETVRRDWSPIARETQKKVLEIILKENSSVKALSYVKEVISKLKAKEITADKLIMQTQLTKEVHEYELIAPHVAIAKKLMEKQNIKRGAYISYIITEGKGLIRDKAKTPEECQEKEYDPEYYINNQVVPAVEKIFEVLGYKKDDLVEKDQKKLDGFGK